VAKKIEGKPFLDKDRKQRFQEKPLFGKQGVLCIMYFIGMEYRREYVKALKDKERNEK
jgi:hypothetical protein